MEWIVSIIIAIAIIVGGLIIFFSTLLLVDALIKKICEWTGLTEDEMTAIVAFCILSIFLVGLGSHVVKASMFPDAPKQIEAEAQ